MSQPEIQIDKRIIVRLTNKNQFDEFVLYDENDKCIVHMERLSDHDFWMRVYGEKNDLVLHIGGENLDVQYERDGDEEDTTNC